MQEGEAQDINEHYPLLPHVLRMIQRGETITADSPFWETYLIARQRGFIHRIGADKQVKAVSPRGEQFVERRGSKK